MLQEHTLAVLTADVPEHGLVAGDVGLVVRVHPGGQSFTVQFVMLGGVTVAVVTVSEQQLRPIHPNEIAHARERVEAG